MLKPKITEKSMMQLESLGEYSFTVPANFTKNDIRVFFEKTFGFKVASVNTKTIKGKSKKVGKARKTVNMTNKKQAIVKLKDKKAKIELFDLKDSSKSK